MSKGRMKGFASALALRLLRQTWQVRYEGRENMDRLCAEGKRFMICFWHGKYIPIFPLLEGCEGYVISTESKRGSVISEICRNFGYHSVLIPDVGKHASFRPMFKELSTAQIGALAVDGPLGPYHRVKTGVVRMASELEFDLLPVSVASRQKVVYQKRWDRMELPLPFTKVCLIIGQPIAVPPGLCFRNRKRVANDLTEALELLDGKAMDIVRESVKRTICSVEPQR